ncbi:MAG: hypothetical protein L0Y70_16420 [Gemmataceae bacterium]|nr:hypothetical protein [Gemmataceae bacterium]
MPSQAAHLELAQRNQFLINHLVKDIDHFADWVTTVAFYRALHLVEAVFAADSNIKHGGDHGNRLHLLKTNRKYLAIYKAYQPLWSASVVARYLEDKQSATEVSSFSKYLTAPEVRATILNHYLRKVESSVEQLLGRSLQAAPPKSS